MKLKILIQTPDLSEGDGIANVIMGQYDALIANGCSVDFAEKEHNKSTYTEKIEKNGGKFWVFKSFKNIREIMKTEKYDILHINFGGFFSYILIFYAKKYKVKKIIWHSHNTKNKVNLKGRIKHILNYFFGVIQSNCYIACTNNAGKDIFGNKKFYILNNAIDVEKFKYDYVMRNDIRKKYNIDDDCFVIGTVCRYSLQKNPIFMLDILKEIKKYRKVKFLWVGSSNDYINEIFDYIEKNNLKDDVIMVGMVSNPSIYYNAMDAFIMPSFWEGLGITYIESQANGIPTYGSDVVPPEAAITDLFKALSINNGVDLWVEQLLKNEIRTKNSSFDSCSIITKKGYNLREYSNELYKLYVSFFKNK